MITSLMAALLEIAGIFCTAMPTAVFIYTILFFFLVPLLTFSFIRTHRRLPAALSQGLFVFPVCSCRLPWKQLLVQLEGLYLKQTNKQTNFFSCFQIF